MDTGASTSAGIGTGASTSGGIGTSASTGAAAGTEDGVPGALLDRLLALGELLHADMARAFAGTALTASRVHLLWVLLHRGPLSQQALSEELRITPRSVSALVDALEPLGYVYRAPFPGDRRAVLVTLTPLATGMMARMQEDHEALERRLRGAVAEEDLAALGRGIDAILAHLSALGDEQTPRYRDVEAGR